MSVIRNIYAREILDSRGKPTVEVDIELENGITARASVPSGASTGKREATELRDGDAKRYQGMGVLNCINTIQTKIQKELKGRDPSQRIFDQVLIKLDETENKSNLGANTTLALSLAYARSQARSERVSLYQWINNEFELNVGPAMPTPMLNVINGGAHANNDLSIQEFMIIPDSRSPYPKQLQQATEIYHMLKNNLQKSKFSTSVGDEGGFAPAIDQTDDALSFLMRSIEDAGYTPGKDTFIALDVASSELYSSSHYLLNDQKLTSNGMIDFLEKLCEKYPIISIEDGLSEDDWNGWKALTAHLGDKVQLVGDDIFVTNATILQEGIDQEIANSILIKPNQIGTLTETMATINVARANNYNVIISHRSGETEDSFIADLAVGCAANYIKTGAPCRSERTSKYNQLLRIQEEL